MRKLLQVAEGYLRSTHNHMRKMTHVVSRAESTLGARARDDRALKTLNQIYTLCDQGDSEGALDHILDAVDVLALADNFERCDELLRLANVDRLDIPATVCFLSATYIFAARLNSRKAFYEAAYARIARERPDVEQVLSDLQ